MLADPILRSLSAKFGRLGYRHIAIDFRQLWADGLSKNGPFNQVYGERANVTGKYRLDKDGYVLDGSSYLTFPNEYSENAVGVGIICGYSVPDINLSGALVKIGDSARGVGIGIGSTTIEADGKDIVGLREGLAWEPTGFAPGSGYHIVVCRADNFSDYTWQIDVDGITRDGPSTGSTHGGGSAGYPVSIGGYAGVSRTLEAGRIAFVIAGTLRDVTSTSQVNWPQQIAPLISAMVRQNRPLPHVPFRIYVPSAGAATPKTATASLNTAVRVGNTATTSLSAAVQAALTATASINAAIRAEQTATASLNVAVQAAVTATASLDTALLQQNTATASVSAAVVEARSLTASLSVALLEARTAGATLDAYVQSGSVVVASLDVAIQLARTAVADLSAAIAVTTTATASLATAVAVRNTVIATIGAAIRQDRAGTASLSAYIYDSDAIVYGALNRRSQRADRAAGRTPTGRPPQVDRRRRLH